MTAVASQTNLLLPLIHSYLFLTQQPHDIVKMEVDWCHSCLLIPNGFPFPSKVSGYGLQGPTQYPPIPSTLRPPLPFCSVSPRQLYPPPRWIRRVCSFLRTLHTLHHWLQHPSFFWFYFCILLSLLFQCHLLREAFPDNLWKTASPLNSVHAFPTLFIGTSSSNF